MPALFGHAKRCLMLPNYEGTVPEVPKISLICVGISDKYKYLVSYMETPNDIITKQDYIIESKDPLYEENLEPIYDMIKNRDCHTYNDENDIQLYKYEYLLTVSEGDYMYTSRLVDFDIKQDRFAYIINMYEKGTSMMDISDNEVLVHLDRLLMAYDLPKICRLLIKTEPSLNERINEIAKWSEKENASLKQFLKQWDDIDPLKINDEKEE